MADDGEDEDVSQLAETNVEGNSLEQEATPEPAAQQIGQERNLRPEETLEESPLGEGGHDEDRPGEEDDGVDPSVEALGRNLDARLATLLGTTDEMEDGQQQQPVLQQQQPVQQQQQPVQQQQRTGTEGAASGQPPSQLATQHRQRQYAQTSQLLRSTQEQLQRVVMQRQLQRLVQQRHGAQETLGGEHAAEHGSGADSAWPQRGGGQWSASSTGRKFSPALLAAAAIVASAASKDEDGRSLWRHFPFDLDESDDEDEPPTLRQRLAHFLQTPCYKAITVLMVSVGMGALVHETNQRALNSDVEEWVSYATWSFLAFSLTDIALHVYVIGWSFLCTVATFFDLIVVFGDVALETLALVGDGSEVSIASRFRSLRALRALRGVRACCGCKELDRMVRRMASSIRAFVTALFLAAAALAIWSALTADLVDDAASSDGAEGAEYYGTEDDVTPSQLARAVDAALTSAQELLLAVAKVLVVGTDVWDIESVGSMDVEQWTAASFLAVVLAMMILKTIADARAEVNAAGIDLDGMPLGWSSGGGLPDDSDDAEGDEPSLEQLRAILLSVTDASNALGEQTQLLRRRRNVLLSGTCHENEAADGSGATGAAADAGQRRDDRALGNSAAENTEEQAAEAVSQGGGEPAEGAVNANGRHPRAGGTSANGGVAGPAGFAASRSAAAAAAAAAAGLELTLSAEDLVRAQFAELRREVEKEVSWRCGLGPPVTGGGLLESAAEGARRWLHGLSRHPLDPAVYASGRASSSVAPSSACDDSGTSRAADVCGAGDAAETVAEGPAAEAAETTPMVAAAFQAAETGSGVTPDASADRVSRSEGEPPILALF